MVYRNNFQVTEEYNEEAHELFQEIGNKWGLSHIQLNRARMALFKGKYEKPGNYLNRPWQLVRS